MDWREHMVDNVLNWLTKGDLQMRLDDNFLMLFGNPYLFQEDKFLSVFSCITPAGSFYRARYRGERVSYCYPLFGAPAVSMYTEAIARLGVRHVLACGYVGGLGVDMEIGSYSVPREARGLDGCTLAYFPERSSFKACAMYCENIAQRLNTRGAKHLSGPIVSIDALMLEDDRMISTFAEQGFVSIDLETACLYALGQSLGLRVAAIHIVSDNPAQKQIDRELFHEASFTEQIEVALAALQDVGS